MSSKTRIWVFHMKELIYTAIFVVLGIVLLLLLIFMFSEDHSERTLTDLSGKYTAGIYTASMTLGGQSGGNRSHCGPGLHLFHHLSSAG